MAAFKQQLGIHHSEDGDFGWIAEVGLQSPLPPRWTAHADSNSGFVYYIDHERQSSSWENPLVPFLRRIVEIGRAYMQSQSEGFFEEQKGLLWHQHKHELDCWHGPFTDDEGRQYYVNSTEGVSSWQDPRIDAQYIFELEAGLLASLEEVLPPPVPDTPGFGSDNDPWRTHEGAEVLVLDGTAGSEPSAHADSPPRQFPKGRPGSSPSRKCANFESLALMTAKEEHKTTLERLSVTAQRVMGLQQEEEEAQRLQFSSKVQERKQRRSQTPKRNRSGEIAPPRTPEVPMARIPRSCAAPSPTRQKATGRKLPKLHLAFPSAGMKEAILDAPRSATPLRTWCS